MATGRAPVKLPYPPIDKNAFPSLSRMEQERLYLDFQALADQGEGTRWGTLVIAPSDATTASKRKADYTLDGSTDTDRLQAAIDAISNRGKPGRIVILEGTVFLNDNILITMTTAQQLTIEGQGSTQGYSATEIISTYSGGDGVFKVNGTSGFTGNTGYTIFRNLGITATSADGIVTNAANVEVDSCSINVGGIGCYLDGGLSGPYRPDFIHDSRIHGSSRGMELRHRFGGRIANNYISGGATGIRSFADAAATGNLLITGNEITAQTGIWLVDSLDSTNTCNTTIVGNRIFTCTTAGIVFTSTNKILVASNMIQNCGYGIDAGSGVISGNHVTYITSNFFLDNTTRHVRILTSTIGTSDFSIVGNKMRSYSVANPTYAVEIGASVQDACVAYNDWYDGYVTAGLLDNGTNTRTEATFLPALLDANARVAVRINSTGAVYTRRRLNFIPGTSDVVLSHADDSGNEEVDFTISLNPAGLDSNARVGVRKNSTGSTYLRRRINFIEGTNATITVADDAANEEVDVTISLSAGLGSGDSEGTLGLIWDGGGSTVDITKTCDIRVPFAGTLDSWEVYLDQASTVEIELWKDVQANYPPTSGDKITASAPITTTADDYNTSSSLTGWSTALTEGDIIRAKINTIGSATKVTVVLHYTRP